jgi:hypothetical protein
MQRAGLHADKVLSSAGKQIIGYFAETTSSLVFNYL